MKAWEKRIKEDRKNLWLIKTRNQNLLCKLVGGNFFVKTKLKTLVPVHCILEAKKL